MRTLPYVIWIALPPLYAAFLLLDIFRPGHPAIAALKYLALVLCFLLALLGLRRHPTENAGLICAALAVTLLADFFLLFTDAYTLGICVFTAAQLLYVRRFTPSLFNALLCVAAALWLLLICAWLLQWELPHLYLAAALYAALILTASIGAFRDCRRSGAGRHAAWVPALGMLLFLLCDINVVFFNLLPASPLHRVHAVAMWLFYLPSQLCLALSARRTPTPRNSHPD